MMIQKILIGMGDSKHAEHAAKYGFQLAQALNAHVGLVNIIEPMAIPSAGSGADEILGTAIQPMPVNYTDILDAQTKVSQSILQNIANKYAGKLQVSTFHEFGSTAEGIINCAIQFNADMIIVGTHARSGFDRLLSEDVAEYVVKNSTVPVLVVPGVVD